MKEKLDNSKSGLIDDSCALIASNPARTVKGKYGRISITLIVLLFIAALFYLTQVSPNSFGPYHDDSIYVVMAKAIATSKGYRIISLPDEPPQTKSPPFYLLLLSFIWWVDPHFPQNIKPMMYLSVLATVLFLALTWLYLVKQAYASRWLALLIVALTAMNWRTVILATGIYSEMVYSALSVAGLYLAEKYECQQKKCTVGILLGLIIGLAFLTRSSGITVVLAVAVYYMLKRRWQYFGPVILGSILVALWLGWGYFKGAPSESVNAGYYESYLHTFNEVIRDLRGANNSSSIMVFLTILGKNAVMLIFVSVPLICLNLSYNWLHEIPPSIFNLGLGLFLVTLILLVAGFRRHCAAGFRLLHIYVILYLCLHLFWPYTAYDRFIMPLLPFFLLFLVTEIKVVMSAVLRDLKLREPIVKKLSAGIVGAVFLLFSGTLCYLYASGTRMPLKYSEEMTRRAAEDAPAIQWIKENTSPSDILLCYRDAMYYLHTGRKAARSSPMREGGVVADRQVSLEQQAKVIFQIIEENKANYLILTWTNLEYKDQADEYQDAYKTLLNNYPQVFIPVFKSTEGNAEIYRIENNRQQ